MRVVANRAAETITADVPKRFSSLIIELPVQQTGSGDPSPDNIRPITQWTDVALYVADTDTAAEPTVTTTLPTPIFGGMVDVARGEVASLYNEKKSSSGWEMVEEGQFRCQVGAFNNGDETSTNVADLYSSHYKTVSNKDAYDATDDLTCGTPTIEGVTYLYVNDLDYTTLEAFTAYIGDVQFVYKSHVPMSDAIEPTIVYLPEGTSYVWAEGAFYVETVTGTPPLSLPNSVGKPLEAWSVELSPYQDLHGYDAPWPAGGGVNKFDYNSIELLILENNANRYGMQYTDAGTYAINAYSTGSTAYIYIRIKNSDDTWLANQYIVAGTSVTGKIVTISSGQTLYVFDSVGNHTMSDAKNVFTAWSIQVALSSTQPEQYYPYSNICPIYGTNQISFVATGKNLMPSGMRQNGASRVELAESVGNYINLPAGTYSLSFDFAASVLPSTYYAKRGETGIRFVDSFTISEAGEYMFWLYKSSSQGGVSVDNVSNVQLEIGSTASDYTPYVAPSQTVITLPQTIYSGTVYDGGAVSRMGVYDLGTLTWQAGFSGFYAVNIPMINVPGDRVVIMCEKYKPVLYTEPQTDIPNNTIFVAWRATPWQYTGTLVIKDSSYTTGSELKASLAGVKLVYPLNTPTVFAVTTPSIPTPKGNATTWATAEDGKVDSMSVSYVRKA